MPVNRDVGSIRWFVRLVVLHRSRSGPLDQLSQQQHDPFQDVLANSTQFRIDCLERQKYIGNRNAFQRGCPIYC
ncbi:hypothetical protein VN12_26215 [Pirellula sp. SH-Sr6A]|nr:hypothetical protein VN12_26215 [Pirellula sp. SH-Sr6A]